MVKDYLLGRTLESIGQENGLTRERVRQILEKMGIERRDNSKEKITIICAVCGKDQKVSPSSCKRKYCSHSCHGKAAKIHRTLDEVREMRRSYMKAYCQTEKGNMSCNKTMIKYLKSPKFLIWYEKYHGHKKGERIKPIIKGGVCIKEGCTRNRTITGKRSNGETSYGSCCYLHRVSEN